ncbi:MULTISPECIES: GNAT family N-acetyltransferase [unclassified Roseovarius]|uniref:GNAT family N-acetyltransferase n=1 Tax=unclassified Roseovarius TaxID=2614913 RepID=UPI000068749B|nr:MULTISPECIES: GNAT family N-acetyltransferase [unclassified Roseovarius]EAQ25084.1 acetyltransferase, GNAT family protein [Roseovarius sp. 217]KJS43669.1 MAG: acetyltransferase [Roseovarius sp. BRH_c41]
MTALTLARPDDLDRLLPLVAAFHDEAGISQADATRRAALLPMLEGSPHGVVYLIGPGRAPIGYIVLSFGWSVEFGGLDGYVDEFYIRPGVRGRGIGTEVMISLPKALAGAGLKALHLEVRRDNEKALKLYQKLRFLPRDAYSLLTREM